MAELIIMFREVLEASLIIGIFVNLAMKVVLKCYGAVSLAQF